MGMDRSSFDDIVIKPPTDSRSYRILNLPNGLCALLVHDPEIFAEGNENSKIDHHDDASEEEEEEVDDPDNEYDEQEEGEEEEEEEEEDDDGGERNTKKNSATKKAAAAMCVAMGSFSDPLEVQGLAHFLEHMLFMGSSDFPDENEYDSYLSKHGGSSNAYTEAEYTCYHFEVNREFLHGALKRFSQFFISPLVKAEAIDREVLSVDSEFNQALQNDSCRLQQLMSHTSLPGHPFNRFLWGNKKSLIDAMKNGINLREKVLQLYRENYLGGLMKLVVIGGEPLDVLEDWVVELFSKIKEGHPSLKVAQNIGTIWKPGKLYRLEAVKDVHVLNLAWSLPCLHKEYLKKPQDYLAHLIGHEGQGSLLFLLKAKGWANSLSAGVSDGGMHRSTVAYIFEISIHLTNTGSEKIYEVIKIVYQYIKLLREAGPQKWIFKELQDIGNMEFRFAEEQPQDDYASELAENLHFYSKEHTIYGEYAFEVWDEDLIEYVLSFFSPHNMRIDIVSKSFNCQLQDVQYEPWFTSRYVEEDIPVSLLEIWGNPADIDPSLHLPLKNDFIPCNFSIRSANLPKSSEIIIPKCIIDQPLLKIWHKLDTTFNVPRANVYFLIAVKGGYRSVKNSVLIELYVNLLKDELNEILYQAGLAKLETALSIIGDKLELKLYGFNDKLPVLLDKILTVSKSFLPTASRFEIIKEDMLRTYRNTNMKPLNHSSYLRLQVLRKNFWDVDDKLNCLSNLTISDLNSFIPEFFSQLHIEGLCHGNLSEKEAADISKLFTSAYPMKPLPKELQHEELVLCLPSGANFIRNVHVKNKLEENSVVELYFQIEQDVGAESTNIRALVDLFEDIIEEPFFDQLRTKEQLGYVVDCSSRMTYRVLGFFFRVQSSKYNPLYLHGRIQTFINGLQDLLDNMDENSFENYRSSLIAKKLEKDPSLTYETNHYWTQIVDKRYLFGMSRMEAEELKNISKDDIDKFYNTYIKSSSAKCRQLVINVWGCNTNMEESECQMKFGTVLEDLGLFKTAAEFYPSLC